MKIYVCDDTPSSSFESKTLLSDALCLLEINLGTCIDLWKNQDKSLHFSENPNYYYYYEYSGIFFFLNLKMQIRAWGVRIIYAVLWSGCIYTCPPVCEQALFNVTNSRPLPFRFQHPAKFSIN